MKRQNSEDRIQETEFRIQESGGAKRREHSAKRMAQSAACGPIMTKKFRSPRKGIGLFAIQASGWKWSRRLERQKISCLPRR